MSIWRLFSLIFYRECLLKFRRRSELLNPFLFYFLVCCLFPLASTPDPKILLAIGPCVIWVAALLSTLLSLPKLYDEDFYDGSIEQFLQSSHSLSLLLFVKVMTHWFIYGLPLVIISPLLAFMYHLPIHAIEILMISLLLGTAFLNLTGSMVAALTVGLGNSGILLAIIILPIYIPGLIFGASSVLMAESNIQVSGILAVLAALLIISMLLTPMASAFALKIGTSRQA